MFNERLASGRNLRSWGTRLGAAANCLIVTVVDCRLKTDLIFPFNLMPFVEIFGTRIDIPISEITAIERRFRVLAGHRLVVRWKDGAYEFGVSDPLAFTIALDPSGRLTANPELAPS